MPHNSQYIKFFDNIPKVTEYYRVEWKIEHNGILNFENSKKNKDFSGYSV